MGDVWYDKALTELGKGNIDLLNDTIKWAALTSGYTFSQTHQFVSDLGANIVGRSNSLGTKTMGSVAEGVFDAADSLFSALTGSTVTQLVMYKDTGNDATSNLLLQVTSAKYTGLPFTPTGADVPLIFPAAGIAKV